jgi:hypothetical protein
VRQFQTEEMHGIITLILQSFCVNHSIE